MDWFKPTRDPSLPPLPEDSQWKEASAIFTSLSKVVKTASGKQDLHFYVDPNLAELYNINLHLSNSSGASGLVSKGQSSDRIMVDADKRAVSDFIEDTTVFASNRKYEPSYLCSVLFQHPDKEVYSVNVYLFESYLGQYAFKSTYYFRKESRQPALRCYARCLNVVKDIKADFAERELKQNELPYHLKRALQGELGELEPKTNKMATYLDPNNIPKQSSIGSENIVYIPSKRNISEDVFIDK